METGISPTGGRLRILGIMMGALTFVVGILATSGVITGAFRNIEIAKPIGIGISILLICFVSYLLISADKVYRKYRSLIYAGVIIAAAGGAALFAALALAPAFEESSLGAGLYGFLAAWGGVLLVADAVVLLIRLRRAGKALA
jgi:hypothetical protein